MNHDRITKEYDPPGIPLIDLLAFIKEDAPFGDVTSDSVVPDIEVSAVIIARQDGVIAGLTEAEQLFTYYGADARRMRNDGSAVGRGDILMTLSGPAGSVLLVERTALNIIGRMSGISTKTKQFVDIIEEEGVQCRIASTRKTAPGLRVLDKKAVLLGGGEAHRFSLSDGILIKDNHLELVPLPEAIAAVKTWSVYRKIEVEVENPEDAILAAEAGADIIMLDNMTPDEVEYTLSELERQDLRQGRLIEISGSVNEQNVRNYALPGVDIISIGALTHSVSNFDVSLDITKNQ